MTRLMSLDTTYSQYSVLEWDIVCIYVYIILVPTQFPPLGHVIFSGYKCICIQTIRI